MIFVDGVQFPCDPSKIDVKVIGTDDAYVARYYMAKWHWVVADGTLENLLQHPVLVSRSDVLKGVEELSFSDAESSSAGSSALKRYVYIFQREYATVNPALVDFVGTDEATTCLGLAIRNPKSGMTSVAHMDTPDVVNVGLSQMLSEFDCKSDISLDVHLVGGFNDYIPKPLRGVTMPRSPDKEDGYSVSLCKKIIEALGTRQERFQIQTLLVLGHNTKMDSLGFACPVFTGFVIETSTGSLNPANFDATTRCPDEIVRRIRVTACYEDPDLHGKLLETYDTEMDHFVIAPCYWTSRQLQIIMTLWDLPDTEILQRCSTSPSAEAPDFVDSLRRQWKYLIEHPKWKDSFPQGLPRFFVRNENGNWDRSLVSVS